MLQVPSARTEFMAGLRDSAPLSLGLIPLAMSCGTAAVSAGLDFWQALAMNWLIFAGASQIATTQLFAAGAPMLIIIATAAIVNLRFMMYSALIAPSFRGLNRRWYAVLGYPLTDLAFGLFSRRLISHHTEPHNHWYYLAIAYCIWLCWQLSALLGIVLGQLAPPEWSLDFILPLTFIAILVPLITRPAMLCAAVASGLAAVLLTLPLKLTLIAAALIGIAAGMLYERLEASR